MPRLAVVLLLIAGITAIAEAGDDPAKARAKELKEGIKAFRLELSYNGEEDKPFYRLILSVPPIGYDRSKPTTWRQPKTVGQRRNGFGEHEEVVDESEDCHKKYDYRKWSEQTKQIGDGTKFKVGGHDYGHMHADWEKMDEGWRTAKVWMCRSAKPSPYYPGTKDRSRHAPP